jgi:8-oxo-dGTP pyrophosphatase MutT (NUDIX family)
MSSLPHDLPARIGARLKRPLPGSEAQKKMAPEMAFGRHRGPIGQGVHRAAVCLCLFWNAEDWWLPLTLRTLQVGDHAGQISLPGGRLERSEGPSQAAAREFQEELGVKLPSESWLGQLTSLYVFASHHHVEVFVTAIAHRPVFQPDANEVADVLLMPVRDLLDPDRQIIATMQRGASKFEVPGYRCDQHIVWGATAMILCEFSEVVQQCLLEVPPPGAQPPVIHAT